MEIPNNYKKILYYIAIIFGIIISAYFVVQIFSEIKFYGESSSNAEHTITVSGHGEVIASPDIANISFTLMGEATTVKDAQAKVAVNEKNTLSVLKTDGVASNDIKTENVSFSPKYEYLTVDNTVPCPSYGCPSGKSVITGYQASETVSVKIRNIDNIGKITQDLGTAGASQLNGPNFSIDNQTVLNDQARSKAITDAKEKAKTLAKELGVSLGSVANFNENSGPYPIMYNAMSASSAKVSAIAPAPAQLPAGQNTITSDVTITYIIR